MKNELKAVLIELNIDVDGAIRRFSGNEALFLKFLMQYPADETIQALRAAVKNNDVPGAIVAAHTMKGVTGNLGITPLYVATSEMVKELRQNPEADINLLFDNVEKAHSQLLRLDDIPEDFLA